MDSSSPVLSGIGYILGEQRRNYAEVPNFTAIAAENQMIEDPTLWGWGNYHKSDRSVIELSIESARETMRSAGMVPSEIDLLILCATEFPPGIDMHATYCKSLLEALNLQHVPFLGVTLHRCGTLLAGLSLANDLVKSGQRRAVLVISSDKVNDETERFQKFALFSDGASSCIVSATAPDGYAIVHAACATDASAMDAAGEISASLAKKVNQTIGNHANVAASRIKVVLHNNLYIPIVRMKEQLGAFGDSQMYLDNISGKGHCFGSDPLINLKDYAAMHALNKQDYLLLTSSTPGSRFAMLLQKT